MKKQQKHSPKTLIVIILSLLSFGLLVIYNATAYFSQFTFGNPFRFVILQLAWIILGLIAFFVVSNISYKKLGNLGYILALISIFFLVILGFSGVFACRSPDDTGFAFAPCINGASRWFYFNPPPLPEIPFVGVLGFQPGEIAKLSIILYLSVQLFKLEKKKSEDKDPFIIYLVTSIVFSTLLLMQPNMSTAVLVFLIGSVVYFVSGNSLVQLFILAPIVTTIGVLGMLMSEYRRARLFTLLGLKASEAQEAGYHIRQIMIALGSGGFFGVGFGQSRQKYQYLPEVASDSIFAIIGEEFGFMGTAAVLLVFGYLIFQGFKIAQNASDSLGRMLASGITSWVALQFFINIAAITKIIPLTGVPIPLISYGGSSVFFTLFALGILHNIQKESI